MISRIFIDRPIFASVLSIVITLAGGIALFTLPIAMYPPISPPTVSVDCNYPGASAQVVAETVAAPIEQQVNGVENMMYMSSQCTNDGTYNLTVTFRHGINLNMAQVLVQNRVMLAIPLLPDVIKQTGVTTRKRSPDILLAIALISPNGRYDQVYLSNYALMHVKDELARLPGISDVTMMGQRDYSMRVWVDPEKLSARSMTAGDVVRAIREQNMQVAMGQLGQQPTPVGQDRQIPLSTLGRLVEPEQFGEIVIKESPDGRYTKLKDVARVELDAKNQDLSSQVDGKPCVSIAIFQLPDANALDTADVVKAKMEELKKDFPDGVDYTVRYDTTPFIRESIEEVFKTLREAVFLVAVVVLLFLQNWRSAVIPLIAVPVAIVGTFAVLAVFGFSLNNLTLFGLVLAIGIVVDDAIVVVEAVEHHIEHGMAPREATYKAMDEVSGPVIAIGLVLTAVFVPCAFITGITGQFFRQFALTIAVSTVISAFNSLTLSPALAALLLRPRDKSNHEVLPRAGYMLLGGYLGYTLLTPWLAPRLGPSLVTMGLGRGETTAWIAGTMGVGAGVALGWLLGGPVNRLLSTFFWMFNAGFNRATNVYTRTVGLLLRLSVIVLMLYGGMLYLTYLGFKTTPTGFIPTQDMGYLLVNVQLPDAASTERTREVMNRLEKIAHDTPGVAHTQYTSGQSLLLSANGSNFASMFVILKPFTERPDPLIERLFRLVEFSKEREDALRKRFHLKKEPSLSGDSIAASLRKQFTEKILDADVKVFPPPPVRGVGRAGGYKIMVETRSGEFDPRVLQGQTDLLVELSNSAVILDDGRVVWKSQDESDGTAPVVEPSKREAPTAKGGTTAKDPGRPAMVGNTTPYRASVPQLFVDVNRTECMTKEVALKDLFDTLQIYLGSLYANDFNRFGRTWQVVVQAEPRFRNKIDDVRKLKVRNANGAMVPLGTLAHVSEITGPLVLTRYNMYPAAPINGNAAPGISSGQAISIMDQIAAKELLPSMSTEWTELAYLELQAGDTAMYVFGVAVLMVFLVLAAQYESWALPLAIILVVPMCLLSAIAGVRIAKEDVNIFTQIGFVVLVGLASKNAILIVEFARHHHDAGMPRYEATLEACKLRLRPIVMTSLAFILGVLPLLLGHGAGSEMRRTLGITVFSGMLGVTAFGIFLTPVFFYAIDMLGGSRLFASPSMQRVNTITLGILTLGLSLLRRFAQRQLATAKPEPLDEILPPSARPEETVPQK